MQTKTTCLAQCNLQNNTHDSLQDMGKRLAAEVADHLGPVLRSTRRPLTRVSFACHSIGNLIMRAALSMPEMQPYLKLMHL